VGIRKILILALFILLAVYSGMWIKNVQWWNCLERRGYNGCKCDETIKKVSLWIYDPCPKWIRTYDKCVEIHGEDEPWCEKYVE